MWPSGSLTVHEVHVLSALSVPQFVGHHPQLHDQLPGPHIRPGNIHLYLGVVDLADQPVTRHIREVPEWGHKQVFMHENTKLAAHEHFEQQCSGLQ